jgi:hypothetical protein
VEGELVVEVVSVDPAARTANASIGHKCDKTFKAFMEAINSAEL